jgi:uncharacterized protein YndB with AHSA1/START domain
MTDRSVNHATFTLNRTYPVGTAQVFAAWADPVAKAVWLAVPAADHEMDFSVGGKETVRGRFNDTQLFWETTYVEIVPAERITYTSRMLFDETVATVSVTTVEFISGGDTTQLTLTEHGAYLDGLELPEWREEGTNEQLNALGKMLG